MNRSVKKDCSSIDEDGKISRLVALIHNMSTQGEGSFFACCGDYRTTRWRYRKVYELAMRFCSLLEDYGINKGDRVVIWGGNSLPLLICFLGTITRGAVLVPLDGSITYNVVSRIIEKVRPGVVICSSNKRQFSGSFFCLSLDTVRETLADYSPQPAELQAVYESDPAEIVFTSGITADPKGVIIKHSNITSLFPFISDVIADLRPVQALLRRINFLALLPLSHLYGQMVQIFIPLMLKSAVVFPERRTPSFLMRTIKKEKITVAVCVPRILEILRLHIINDLARRGKEKEFWKKYHLVAEWPFVVRYLCFPAFHYRTGLRFLALVVGGAKLEPEVHEFFRRLSFAVFYGYGLTETSPIVSVFNPLKDKQGSVGKVAGNQQVKIAEDGEILVKGPNVSEGYYGDSGRTEKSLQEGWLRTGDIGSFDPEGHLYFLGRKKDVIVTPEGLNVYPEDIESVLNAMPSIKDSAVFAMDRDGREQIVAVLLVAPGAGSAKDTIRKANSILSPSQRIKHYYLWPETDFPRTSLLKAKKREIAERFGSLEAERQVPAGNDLVSLIGRQANVGAGDISPSLKLGPGLGLSSLDRLELALNLEKHFQVSIPDSLLDEHTSISQLEGFLLGRMAPAREIAMPRFGDYPVLSPLRFFVCSGLLFPLLRIFCRLEVEGIENLNGVEPPVIFIANHSSHLDTPVVLKALPRRFCIRVAPAMKIDVFREYFHPSGDHPMIRFLHFSGYISLVTFLHVYPFSPASFRRSFTNTGELIEKGFCPLIFPEGRRTVSGDILPFKEGIGHLAVRTRVPVVPLRLRGTYELFPPGAFFPKRGHAAVHIGTPRLFADEEPKHVSKKLREIIENL